MQRSEQCSSRFESSLQATWHIQIWCFWVACIFARVGPLSVSSPQKPAQCSMFRVLAQIKLDDHRLLHKQMHSIFSEMQRAGSDIACAAPQEAQIWKMSSYIGALEVMRATFGELPAISGRPAVPRREQGTRSLGHSRSCTRRIYTTSQTTHAQAACCHTRTKMLTVFL
jgi:hypothetical protein